MMDRGAVCFGDLPDSFLQQRHVRLSCLSKLLSLLCFLLVGRCLSPRKLRLRLRVRLLLPRHVALLSGGLRVSSRLRSLLSESLRCS